MKYGFITIVMALLIGLAIIFYIANQKGLLTKENNISLFNWAFYFYIVMFVGISFTVFWNDRKKLITLKGMMGVSLLALMVYSFYQNTAYYLTAFFALMAVANMLVNKTYRKPHWLFYFLLAFVLLRLVGSFNTSPFYRYWDRMISFIVIPLAFSCFRFSAKTLQKILLVFVRMVVIYLVVTIVLWWYHVLQADINPLSWLTSKLNLSQEHTVYFWTSAWSGFEHPSFNSIYIIAGLIGIICLVKVNRNKLNISLLEVVLVSAISLFTTMVFESRIGFVIVLSIIIFSYLYFLWNRKKIFIANALLIAIASIFLFSHFSQQAKNFINDDVRKLNYTLAIHYIKDHPWWGTGYYEQAEALSGEAAKLELTEWEQYIVRTYTHNQFLGDMVQFGVVGLVVLLSLLISLVVAGIMFRSYTLLAFTFTLFMFMLIEEPLYIQAGITRFTLFFSFFLVLNRTRIAEKRYTGLIQSEKSSELVNNEREGSIVT